MNQSYLLGAVSACAITFISLSAQAVSVNGQGTWESTLQGRDLDGNAATYEAYYDTTLDITWLADANAAGMGMDWATANAWAAGLNVNGITGWRLPTNTPLNGSNYNTTRSADGTTDESTAKTTTDGSDGGWRDSSGTPVSEMGHMFYVTLGNLGFCNPTLSWCTEQSGWGLSNTADFLNIQPNFYWSGSEFDSNLARVFRFSTGSQGRSGKGGHKFFAWAVRSGDVSAVPVPVPVGGTVTGMIPQSISCENQETQQRVSVPLPDNGSWDCEAAGLQVRTGDSIIQSIVGTAD